MIPVGRVTDSNMVPINALGRGFLFKPQQTPANDVVPPTFSEQLQTLTVDATPEVPPPGFFGIRVRRDNQPDAYAIDEKAESELENAILSQKGKPFEEIMPYKMEPSRYHKPIPRLATEILQDDEKMKAFYENAQLLDDKMVELSENFISNDLEHRSWEELQLNKQLIKCLVEKCHYKAPRQVQSAVIQKIHQGKNVVCQAENAAGKTMAYIVPIIDYLITQLSAGLYQRKAFPTPMAIVLVPTRELAIQVTEQFNKVLGGMENAVGRAVFCFGQTDQSASFASCANAEIIVACPGRLGHFLGKNAIRTDCLKMLVFDEIDVFAEDRSFVDQLNDIGSYFKNSIQLLFFSSSLSGDAFVFIDEWTHGDHCSISNDKKFLAAKLQFKFFFVKETVIRSNICAEYIKKHCAASGGGASKAVVFCDTREEAFKMAAMLRNKNFNSEVMSADMNQAHREAIVKKLRKSKNDMVVFTSNVFARGLDIAEVEHVVVLKLDMKQDFFNRCGRTGRLKDGFVHVFVSEMANHNDLVSLDLALKSIGHPTPDEIKHLIRGMKKLVNFATSV